jgi:hypothetical protein
VNTLCNYGWLLHDVRRDHDAAEQVIRYTSTSVTLVLRGALVLVRGALGLVGGGLVLVRGGLLGRDADGGEEV